MNLLIVDDEVIAVKGMLMGIDWPSCGINGEVYSAYDAEQAYQIVHQQPVDIILCDIEMPGDNGIELIRKVKADRLDIACIFLTCHAKFEYAQEAIKLGCEDYILTPAPYEAIMQTVDKVAQRLVKTRKDSEVMKYGSQWLQQQEKSVEAVQGDRRSTKEIVEDTAGYILTHLATELTVSSLAKRSYLNEDYLNRIFKREKGVSLNQFIIQERMALAARLLENDRLSIAAVAAQVGYSSYSYFVSTFKKVYGHTPTQHREQTGGA